MITVLDAKTGGIESVLEKLAGRTTGADAELAPERLTRSTEIFGTPLQPGEAVRRILHSVRKDGDRALLEWTEKIDGVRLTPENLRIDRAELCAALDGLDPAVRRCLEKARKNIADYQRSIMLPLGDNFRGELGVKYTPVRRVGAYVPGGLAAYPSSVLMNVVPAQTAGVTEIAVATPPGKDGVNPVVLAVCGLLEVDEVYRIGGAQAIGAFAYGTASVPKVDMIVGPGNIYVAAAKREVFGTCGIDMIAGPSEILVICDGTTDPAHVAADMLSQAEHDPMASSIALSLDEDFARRLLDELARRLEALPKRRIAADSLADYGFIVNVRDAGEAVELSNRIAPEHLEILTEEPLAILPLISNAGAIFIGQYSPEPIGDYTAGPSHTLPTGGTARFSSGLTANSFIKSSSLINLSRKTFDEQAHVAAKLARCESLEAHARSVEARK